MIKNKRIIYKVRPSIQLNTLSLSFTQRCFLAVRNTFDEYIQTTKQTGIWLLNKRINKIVRIIWTAILLLMFSFSCYSLKLLWESYYDHPIVTDLTENIPIDEVPFPSVTLCGDNTLEPKVIDDFISSLKIPHGFTEQEVRDALPLLANYNLHGEVDLSINYTALEATLLYNNVSILAASKMIKYDCDVLALRCFMNGLEFDCQHNELFAFKNIFTVLGSCCALTFKESKGIFHNSFGIASGLVVVGRYTTTKNTKNSLSIYVHHPQDAIPIVNSPMPLIRNSVTYIKVKPAVHTTSANVLELPAKKRWCFTKHDVHSDQYRYEHCSQACAQQVMVEACGCIPILLLNSDKVKIHPGCILKDIECFFRNREKVASIQCDACMANCHDIVYETAFYYMKHVHNFSNLFLDILKSENASHLTNYYMARVYFDAQDAPHYNQVFTMPFITLLSNLGGIFSVWVGITVISIIETFYYIFYRLLKNYYKLKNVK